MSKNGFYNGFLPDSGLVFLDTCGPRFVPGANVYTQFERLEDFIPILSKRGGVLSSPLVIEELHGSVRYFRESEKDARDRMNGLGGGRSFAAKEARRDTLKWIKASRKMKLAHSDLINMLEDGRRRANLVENKRCSRSEIEVFYNEFPGIHLPEIELLTDATFFEGVNGFFSADRKALEAYACGLREFGESGFVCNSICDKSYLVG